MVPMRPQDQTPGVAGRTAFTLRVQTGCGESCSYCIIPTTRGLPRSASIDEVLSQIARVTAAGFKGQTLTGIGLAVDQTVKLPVVLQPGVVEQSIEVTGAAPLVDASVAQASAVPVISAARPANLPLPR